MLGRRASRCYEVRQDEVAELRARLPAHRRWQVCFDGRRRGTIATELPALWGEHEIGGLTLAPGEAPPWVGDRRSEFAATAAGPVHRPLVVVDAPSCAGPEQWKRVELTRNEFTAAWPRIAKVLGVGVAPIVAGAHPRLVKAYRNNRGERLLSIHTGAGDASEQDLDDFLVYQDERGEFERVGDGLTLVDAGDYDGDGKSEIVAMYRSMNVAGLVLFTPDWAKHGDRFLWGWFGREEPPQVLDEH
jgi:hypothetical protein